MYDKALAIAWALHHDQQRRDGQMYVYHPIAVANLVKEQLFSVGATAEIIEQYKSIAVLHDVLEDTNVSIQFLSLNFPKFVVDGIKALTKSENQDYIKYIKSIPPEYRIVKCCDTLHNIKTAKPKTKELYIKGLDILNAKSICNFIYDL